MQESRIDALLGEIEQLTTEVEQLKAYKTDRGDAAIQALQHANSLLNRH